MKPPLILGREIGGRFLNFNRHNLVAANTLRDNPLAGQQIASDPRELGHDDALAKASILVVDDEPGMRNFLKKTLDGACGRVDVVANTADASAALDQVNYDVVVLDNLMPKQTGVEWLAEQSQIGLFADAILITAHADLETAIAALKAGASDFLLKPFRSNQLLNAVTQSLLRAKLRRQNVVLQNELETGRDILKQREALVGTSAKIEDVRIAIQRAATTNSQVVIRGEVGSGSQVAARMLHNQSIRADNPFVWLQCNGLVEETFRARLLGHLAHQFGGIGNAAQDGMLVNAAGGTLYLEDVDALPPACQMMLTELLTEGRFQPIGAARSMALDVRIVASTNHPLESAVADGKFRQDLFYLLNVIEIALPPLRERSSDIIELTEFFIESLAPRMAMDLIEITPPARRRLLAHNWPGNVMELRNTVERALIQGGFDKAISDGAGSDTSESLAEVEKRHILDVLRSSNGNRAEAARRLGVARKTIDRKCQSWGL
ncbi:MAG: sigma-54 dependent transcriptional regulator [Pseudomonadota bacterium]